MEAALERIRSGGGELIPRAYELFPEPFAESAPIVEMSLVPELESMAEELGIDLNPPASRPTTRKAHEASRFAREHGLEPQLRRAIYQAYWSDGRDIGRIDVLTGLGSLVGLDSEALRIALDIDRFTPDVVRDMEVARLLRVPGTPTLFIGTGPRATVVVGARTITELQDLIDDSFRHGEDGSQDV
jgi:predicted DsbA family dithiol-disulfide isomerase